MNKIELSSFEVNLSFIHDLDLVSLIGQLYNLQIIQPEMK